MKRVTGIGGVFFSAKDPAALRSWYQAHLGIDVQEWGGTAFRWVDEHDVSGRRCDHLVDWRWRILRAEQSPLHDQLPSHGFTLAVATTSR